MPSLDTEVVLWGEDAGLAAWLAEQGIKSRAFGAEAPAQRELILVSAKPGGDGGAAAWTELMRRVARGSSAIFLSPDVFQQGGNALARLPLKTKGTLARMGGWLYHKDEWAKQHPIFDGLQSGGMMDYAVYRDIIPDLAFAGGEEPSEPIAGANDVSCGYSAGLMVARYDFGEGRFILNTLNIQDNLGKDPAAERLLRNLLRYMAPETGKAPTAPSENTEGLLTGLGYR
jgi:hypothetical protein